jgi:outer membrane protein
MMLNNKQVLFIAMISFVSVIISPNVIAQDNNRRQGIGWGVGLGMIAERSPIIDVGAEYHLIPFLMYRGERFFFMGPTLGYTLLKSQGPFKTSLALQARYRFTEVDSGDSAFLHGMADRDETVEGGIAIKSQTRYAEFGLTLMTDLLSRHQGQQVGLSLGKGFRRQHWLFKPSLRVNWQSRKLTNYYYGVKENEATPIRPAYQADATVNFGVGLDINYMFSRSAMIRVGLGVEQLGSNITDSPIVEYDWVPKIFMGYIYRF